jgi:5'-nucleotidase
MEELQLNRRAFIKIGATLAGGTLLNSLPLHTFAKSSTIKLTILHTNDWHSRIEPFDKNSGKNSGMGGAAVRSQVINKIRKEEENVLLLDAGDVFQGTPYFNMFGGELEYKLMSMMGYDAMTLGNHDFDNGIAGLSKQLPHANFPILCANYDFSATELYGKIKNYKVFEKGGLRIGVFGIGIELDGLVPKTMYGNTKYLNPVEKANEIAAHLKLKEKCDFIICLSHLGYKYQGEKISDIKLAPQSNNIDLILGGHTHTFMPKPDELKNASGKQIFINQVGWGGLQLGRIDYYFNKQQASIETVVSTAIPLISENA